MASRLKTKKRLLLNIKLNLSNFHFYALLIFLLIVFVMGSGARSDLQSLIIIRPISAILLGSAIATLKVEHLKQYRFLIFFGALTALVVAIQLVPIPFELWKQLPGRGIAAEALAVAGVAPRWRPISLLPFETWNSLFSLMVPCATLLLAIQCTREQRFLLLPIFISIGVLSGFLGLLQAISPEDSWLYFYRITNEGSAVGLFANRNHEALLLACLIPMLALEAGQARTVEKARLWLILAVSLGTLLVPLILVTGSRAGLFFGFFGILTIPWLYRAPQIKTLPKRKAKKANIYLIALIGTAVALSVLTIILARAEAFDRLLTPELAGNNRVATWQPILRTAWEYFPVGSGFGTFSEAYQIGEERALLTPQYLNHAHNDWLEVAMTGGLAGLILLGVALAAWARRTIQLIRLSNTSNREPSFARLGSVLILMLGFGSVVDYPLRVPSLTCLAVVAAVWMSTAKAVGRSS